MEQYGLRERDQGQGRQVPGSASSNLEMETRRAAAKRTKGHKQYSLPAIFDTAEEAAELLAVVKGDMKAKYEGRLVMPPKQISRAARHVPRKPVLVSGVLQLQPIVDSPTLPHIPIVATAIPIPRYPFSMPHFLLRRAPDCSRLDRSDSVHASLRYLLMSLSK